MARDYQLLVPAAYGTRLKVTGTLGAIPDTDIVDGPSRCRRSTLPSSLDRLTFQVFDPPHPLWRPPPRAIQNFYHLGDFFLASGRPKDLLKRRLGGGLQVKEVDMRYQDGSRVPEPYFALKVVRTVDCIDPGRSFCSRRLPDGKEQMIPFTELTVSYSLHEQLVPEFANVEGGIYRSFPTSSLFDVAKVTLIDSAIPTDAALFQPAFWPAWLLVSPDFAESLAWACEGGTMGYYFWTLDLENVGRSHHELMHALR